MTTRRPTGCWTGSARHRFARRFAPLGSHGQDEPLPILGVFLSWGNHDVPAISRPEIHRLLQLDRSAYRAYVSSLVAAYQDPEWRAQELEFLRSTAVPIPYDREAVLADNLFPHGTARDYARIMAGVSAGTFISPAVAEVMSGHLQWIMQIPAVADRFFAWGQKGGALVGVVTDTNFFVARGGDFPGKRRVAVLFLRHLSVAPFMSLFTTGTQTLFDAALANDQAFFTRAAAVLAKSDERTER